MPVTNTLETARRIETLGFTHQQAQGLSELLEGTAQDAIREMKTLVSQESETIRAEFHTVAAEIRAEFRAAITEIRAELRATVAELRAEFREELRKQMLWFFTVQVALFGVAVALIKIL